MCNAEAQAAAQKAAARRERNARLMAQFQAADADQAQQAPADAVQQAAEQKAAARRERNAKLAKFWAGQ